MSAPVRRAREAAERRLLKKAEKQHAAPMMPSPMEKKMWEKAKQLQFYRQWKAEIREGLKRGDYGPEIIGLFKILRKISKARDLVTYVENSRWLLDAPGRVQLAVYGYISHAIMLHRERNGYSPFDDAMPTFEDGTNRIPPDKEGASMTIRKLLTRIDQC